MLRFLLVEAAQVTVRSLPEWRSKYVHLMMRRGRKIAVEDRRDAWVGATPRLSLTCPFRPRKIRPE